MTIQDWGITYDDLEPHYDRFEYLCGTSGTAGNIKGQIQDGGNPFEGARSRPYPTPAQKQPFGYTLFANAAREMGYKPFPQPSGNLSQAYTNPLGVKLGPCTYCGFCEWFGCANYSKASPQTTIIPALIRKPNFEMRMRGHAHQSRQYRQASHRRDLRGHIGGGMGATGGSGVAVRVPALQRAASAALGHRHGLRSAKRQGSNRSQLLAPDNVRRDRLL
jgi:choline dehydrogenase-like flavoprotein